MKLLNSTEWLFFHLWKKNPETGKPCPSIRIPETIFFRWAYPNFLYTTEGDSNITRQSKDQININEIREHFSSSNLPNNLSSIYINQDEKKINNEDIVQIEYLTNEDCSSVFFQRERTLNCLIQKILPPKDDRMNIIKVSWCPDFSIVHRRVNKHNLNNKNMDILSKMVTFEGPDHLSQLEPICSPKLEMLIENTCNDIANHIQIVSGNNIQIAWMTLYFRCDKKTQLWLSFVSRLKVRNKSATNTGLPVSQDNLSPRLVAVPSHKSNEHNFCKNYMKQSNILKKHNINNNLECLLCNQMVENLYNLKYRCILEFLLSGNFNLEASRVNKLNKKVMESLERKVNLTKQPVEKLLLRSFYIVKNEIVKYIFHGEDQADVEQMKRESLWQDVIVHICERCYLKCTKIFQDKRMKNEFSKNLPNRDHIKKKKFQNQEKNKDLDVNSGNDFSDIYDSSREIKTNKINVQGKVDCGRHKNDQTNIYDLKGNRNLEDREISVIGIRSKSVLELSKEEIDSERVISKLSLYDIDEARKKNERIIDERKKAIETHTKKQLDSFMNNTNNDKKFNNFLNKSTAFNPQTFHKRLLAFKIISQDGDINLKEIDKIIKKNNKNAFDNENLPKTHKLNKYGDVELPGWKPPIISTPSKLLGWRNEKDETMLSKSPEKNMDMKNNLSESQITNNFVGMGMQENNQINMISKEKKTSPKTNNISFENINDYSPGRSYVESNQNLSPIMNKSLKHSHTIGIKKFGPTHVDMIQAQTAITPGSLRNIEKDISLFSFNKITGNKIRNRIASIEAKIPDENKETLELKKPSLSVDKTRSIIKNKTVCVIPKNKKDINKKNYPFNQSPLPSLVSNVNKEKNESKQKVDSIELSKKSIDNVQYDRRKSLSNNEMDNLSSSVQNEFKTFEKNAALNTQKTETTEQPLQEKLWKKRHQTIFDKQSIYTLPKKPFKPVNKKRKKKQKNEIKESDKFFETSDSFFNPKFATTQYSFLSRWNNFDNIAFPTKHSINEDKNGMSMRQTFKSNQSWKSKSIDNKEYNVLGLKEKYFKTFYSSK